MVSQPAAGHRLRGPPTKAQRCVHKRGNKAMLKPQTLGFRGEETNFQTQPAAGNRLRGRGRSYREAEGLRMDGILALGLWDVVIEVLRSSKSTKPPNNPQQETVRADTSTTPNKREPKMLINCRMWTTLPQTHTLLKVSLSCTFLKTKKL